MAATAARAPGVRTMGAAYAAAQSHPAPQPQAPPGTLLPGTNVQIGEYLVTVERFLSEGGFAHVYLVRSAVAVEGTTQHVLKRVAVPDKEALKGVRKEVDIMKQLKGHRHIVSIIEASASQMTDGSSAYEVFILMEFCAGGGIIDMMNTRLQNRLTESEILKIFSDVCEAVAHMHFQQPPLIHRDLKVENILLASANLYKLCDFGSTTAAASKPPQSIAEIQAVEADLNKSTTLQYRAPEMCDVWSRKPIGTAADIWALGVLLYKLCYYTTPFEEHGPLAILNVQYKIPPYPAYSDHIKGLIASMLQENGSSRPTIYEVYTRVCQLRGTTPKFENRAKAPARLGPSHSALDPRPSPPISQNVLAAPSSLDSTSTASASLVDSISPMRRGRLARSGAPNGAIPDASPAEPAAPARMVRTGLAKFSSSTNDGERARQNVTATLAASARSQGFDDAFIPTSVPTIASESTAAGPKLPPKPTKYGTGVSAPSTKPPAAFDDLLPQRRPVAQASLPMSAMARPTSSPSNAVPFVASAPRTTDTALPSRPVSATRVGSATGTATFGQVSANATSSIGTSLPRDFPGQSAAPPRNLAPPSGYTRPATVSRASQTSPELLADLVPSFQNPPPTSAIPVPTSSRRASPIPLGTALSAPVPSSSAHPKSASSAYVDLLSGDDSPLTSPAAGRPVSSTARQWEARAVAESTQTLSAEPDDFDMAASARQKYPDLDFEAPSPAQRPSAASPPSSDDDLGPEDITSGRRYGGRPPGSAGRLSASRQSTRSDSDSGGGNFDLDRALNSLRKFAPGARNESPASLGTSLTGQREGASSAGPSAAPPSPSGSRRLDLPSQPATVRAPSPRKSQASISNLVSRYETLVLAAETTGNNALSSDSQESRRALSESPKAPAKPPKPAAMQQGLTGSSIRAPPASPPAPLSASTHNGVSTSQHAASPRAPFRPSKPQAVNQQSAAPLQNLSDTARVGSLISRKATGSPEEEKFAGVENMRNRWEQKVAASELGEAKGQHSRQNSVSWGAGKARQPWKAV